MSSNKFDALGSDDSEVEESLNNHHQMEVEKTQPKLNWYTVWSPYVGNYFINFQIFLWLNPISRQVEPAAFTPVLVPEGQHRLQSQYCLWYSRRSPGKQNHNFDQNLKLIGDTRLTFRASYECSRRFHNHGECPYYTRAFSWLKGHTY